MRRDPIPYDRAVSRERFLRLVLAPTLLFFAFAGTALALALLHPAKPTLSTAGSIKLGDAYNGETVFSTTCAGCHGEGGKGGGIGPRLAGVAIPISAVKAQIDNGGGSMPAGLVKGKQEKDVLAYVATILARP
jgi:mono/diheme cytochrome c family protein